MSTGALGDLLENLYGGGQPSASNQGSPTMGGYGFNWYGGQPTTPEGGYYNQMAQMMAGPSYAPQGSNYYSGGSPVSSPGAGKGAAPEVSTPSIGAKGALQAPSTSQTSNTPRAWQGGMGLMRLLG